MITVIAGTGRRDSRTLQMAQIYTALLSERSTEEVKLLSLEAREVWHRGNEMIRIEEEYLIPSERFAFIMPEYNGSFPGILKVMMDNSDIKRCWWGKKAMLTGVADGRAGNLRGLEHMTGILQYLKMHVLHDRLPVSRINEELSKDGMLLKEDTKAAILQQIDSFLAF